MFESFVILKPFFWGLILFWIQRNFSTDDELKLIRHMQTFNQYIGAKTVEFKVKTFFLTICWSVDCLTLSRPSNPYKMLIQEYKVKENSISIV